jgi:acetylornithine deacetylase
LRVETLQVLEKRLNYPSTRHPLFKDFAKPINFNLGKIHGGEWASTVPSRAVMDVRAGFFPGHSVAWMRNEVETHLREHCGDIKYEVT